MEAPLLLPVSTAAAASSSIDIDDTVVHGTVPDTEPASPSTRSIVFRVVAVLAVACASLFAQYEASKGFAIDVVKSASPGAAAATAGSRFDLFFVSNGRAERMVHRASRGVERALFPHAAFPRKHVTRVTVKMAGHNLSGDATVGAGGGPGGYVISLSPGLMSGADRDAAVAAAVRRSVARMWLWDGHGAAPAHVIDSMVRYLAGEAAPQPDLDDGLPQCMSARYLRHLEQRRGGFVARLNRAMRDRWSDAAVDAALGSPAGDACAAYRAALTSHAPGSTSDAPSGSRAAI